MGLDFPKARIRGAGGVLDYNWNMKTVPDKPIIDPKTKKPKLDGLGNPKYTRRLLTSNELKEFRDAREGLANAYLRAGDVKSAIIEAGLDPKKHGSGFLNWLRHGRTSPWSWMKSMNPFKGPVSRGVNGVAPLAGLKLLRSQLGKIISRHPKLSGIAALALLAGGGKAVHDYTKD